MVRQKIILVLFVFLGGAAWACSNHPKGEAEPSSGSGAGATRPGTTVFAGKAQPAPLDAGFQEAVRASWEGYGVQGEEPPRQRQRVIRVDQ